MLPASPLSPASISGGGGGGDETAEAHAAYDRYLTGYTIPNGTQIRHNQFATRRISHIGGCRATLPTGTVAVPEGADTVTIPGGTTFTLAQTTCSYNIGIRAQGESLTIVNDLTATVASATITSVPREHQHGGVAVGVTGTGFYCGRRYDWSEFAPDENRALFITASRVSLIGWVWVDADGQQIAHCTGHRPIFRPADQ